jgi:uncharacterized protein (DUF697 family)
MRINGATAMSQTGGASEKNAPTPAELRTEAADRLIRDYVMVATGAGLIPFPFVDAVAIATLEVSMISRLADIYEFPVPRKLVAYKLLVSLAASVGPIYFSTHLLNLATNIVPFGFVAYALLMGGSAGVSVYAVGKLFQKHYESGGTFLSNSSDVVKKYFTDRYAEGERIVPAYTAGR